MNMEDFMDLEEQDRVTREDFIKFLQRRRSHRNFLEKEIPLEMMEALFNACRLAPNREQRAERRNFRPSR
jgi:hypothetical protein